MQNTPSNSLRHPKRSPERSPGWPGRRQRTKSKDERNPLATHAIRSLPVRRATVLLLCLAGFLFAAGLPPILAITAAAIDSLEGAIKYTAYAHDSLQAQAIKLASAIDKLQQKVPTPLQRRQLNRMMADSKEMAEVLNERSSQAVLLKTLLADSLRAGLAALKNERSNSSVTSGRRKLLSKTQEQWIQKLERLVKDRQAPDMDPGQLTYQPNDDIYTLQQKIQMLETWIQQLQKQQQDLKMQEKKLLDELKNLARLRSFSERRDPFEDMRGNDADPFLPEGNEEIQIQHQIKQTQAQMEITGESMKRAQDRLKTMRAKMKELIP